jgi:hypothetical protein
MQKPISNLIFILLGLLAVISAQAQTVTSDKPDYAPGEYVIITGSGWQPGETVALDFHEIPQVCTSDHHERTAVADSNGDIEYAQFLINDKHMGLTFELTATGLSSGLTAFTTFTDAAYQFGAVGLPAGISVTVDYTISGNGGGNGPVTSSSFTPPALTTELQIQNKTITVTSFNLLALPLIKYQILNYGIRVGPSTNPTTATISNVFNLGANNPASATLFIANYGALVASSASATYGNSVNLTSRFYSNYQTSTGISGKTITFYINGTSVGSAPTDGSGVATLNIDLANVPTLAKLDVGTYTITSSFAGDLSLLAVPHTKSNSAALTVNQRPATVTADSKSKTYGDPDPALTGTLSGFLAADGVTALYSRTAGESVAGSPYVISATLSPEEILGNYDITYNTADFTINAKAASVSPVAAGKTYGDADPAFTGTLTGFLAGDGVTAVYSRTAGETVLGSPYTISAVLSPAGVLSNYNVTYNTANFTINAKAASVSPIAAAKTYGDADPAFTGTLTGFLAGDGVTAVYSRTAGETVLGSPYTISAVLSPVAVLSNYNITYNTAAFTINAKAASVSPNVASKTYGDADPAFTGTLTGFLAADGVTAAYSRTAGETVLGSPYTISAVLSPAAALSNYDITYNTAAFTINVKAASVSPNAASKTYGDADPAFTGTLSGFLAGDAVTATYSRTAGETVAGSPYVISATLSPAGALGNYNITYNTANFTITKRPITVTGVNASKFCSQVDPALTYAITGTLVSPTHISGNVVREAGETVGTYAILQGSVALTSNYDLTYVPGVFTINGISVSVPDANSIPVPVGSSVTFNATITSVPAVPGSLAGIPVVFVLDDGNAATADITKTGFTDAAGNATVSVSGLLTEVYKVTVTAGVDCADPVIFYKPIYDPSGGFVTGGGWINSPAGAYSADLTLIGKANFGFVSKYKKGSTVPEGNTEFQFHAGDLNFASSSYNAGSLVVAGTQAIYRGIGTINGSGSYNFMVSVVDGSPDKFRIKITQGSSVVYDNNMGADENGNATTALSGGSIVIHAVKAKAAREEVVVIDEIAIDKLSVYPNPIEETVHVTFTTPAKTPVNFNIVDTNGRSLLVRDEAVNQEGKYDIHVGDLNLRAGLYVLRVAQGTQLKTIKLLKK